MIDIDKIQNEVGVWARKNFGPGSEGAYHSLLGMVEELGELTHGHLKQCQNIRGELHETEIKDAIGDLVIYLCDYCSQRGYDLEEIITITWAQVKQRDWAKNKKDGING